MSDTLREKIAELRAYADEYRSAHAYPIDPTDAFYEALSHLGTLTSGLTGILNSMDSSVADDSVTVCTCEWAHPVDGSIDPLGPAEIEPDCPAHGWRDPAPEPTP